MNCNNTETNKASRKIKELQTTYKRCYSARRIFNRKMGTGNIEIEFWIRLLTQEIKFKLVPRERRTHTCISVQRKCVVPRLEKNFKRRRRTERIYRPIFQLNRLRRVSRCVICDLRLVSSVRLLRVLPKDTNAFPMLRLSSCYCVDMNVQRQILQHFYNRILGFL